MLCETQMLTMENVYKIPSQVENAKRCYIYIASVPGSLLTTLHSITRINKKLHHMSSTAVVKLNFLYYDVFATHERDKQCVGIVIHFQSLLIELHRDLRSLRAE